MLRNPADDHLYLLATPRYFREKVCSWMGAVKDVHIGWYDESNSEFKMIDNKMSFSQREDSDIDEGSKGEETD